MPGQTPTPALLQALLTDPSGTRVDSINFTQFLSMMGQHLLQLDAEQDLLEAFASFDEGDKGWVKVDEVKRALVEMGDRMNEAEVSAAWFLTDPDGPSLFWPLYRSPGPLQLRGMGKGVASQ
jgi:Ca2+-binding EF-hand superfamily protein